MGTLTAFVVPARDTLLSRVVRHGRERAIAITSAALPDARLATAVPILYARVHIEAIARDEEMTPSPPPP